MHRDALEDPILQLDRIYALLANLIDPMNNSSLSRQLVIQALLVGINTSNDSKRSDNNADQLYCSEAILFEHLVEAMANELTSSILRDKYPTLVQFFESNFQKYFVQNSNTTRQVCRCIVVIIYLFL